VTFERGPAPPRLLGLRLQGFKSFAERTVVEFGSGISAVVGPNGSGKSNLADALRWALGEQGRALRSRKAEDVIWAGSEKRTAQGMADVTLVVDNADGLLPVDFQVLELGRRLYRSGENEYLLNKQRIRLRDLVDLLDAAHLADNAFLFIGQGMVDQALSLRPEERRPLFEEVAGVRRHERRRRKAEEQLLESESNLSRVEDILAELRPQVRRLAAQAEQQASRSTIGEELTAALLLNAHARWHEVATRASEATVRGERARAEVDAAMTDLTAAEGIASTVADALAARARLEAERREGHDLARAALTVLQLSDGRLTSELEAIGRDRARLTTERDGAEADAIRQRRALAAPIPSRDADLERAVGEAERALADALAELATLRAATQAKGEELAAVRRAEAVRAAELETARRRLVESDRQLAELRTLAAASAERRDALDVALAGARETLAAAIEAERVAVETRERARESVESTEALRAASADRAARLNAMAATARGRLQSLEARIAEDEARGIARAAKRHGGRRVDDDLVVEPAFRAAVEAALAGAARAYVVGAAAVTDLGAERGLVVVEERTGAGQATADARERRFRDALAVAGGGILADAVGRDGAGVARRLLAHAAWLPDLPACLAIQADLPAGWIAVPRDGAAVVGELTVSLGAADPILERRAELSSVAADVARLEADAAAATTESEAATEAATHGRAALERARRAESAATTARRRAEETERSAARDLESVAREAAWHAAQAERSAGEVVRHRETVSTGEAASSERATVPRDQADAPDGAALALWESRASDLRATRDRLVADLGVIDAARREAENLRARTEAGVAMGEERAARSTRDLEALEEREAGLREERDRVRADLAAATEAESAARAAIRDLQSADLQDRDRLGAAERAASAARERLRAADERSRAAERSELETRLGADALREQVLVELAGIGDVGIRGLAAVAGLDPDGLTGSSDEVTSEETAALQAALDVAVVAWAAEPPAASPPGPGRLAQLRRRFHELGAADPNALEDHAALSERLSTLEAQGTDLRTAIAKTRELIAELDTLIADQFRTTFAALETAFEARFEQLFGGGYARLSLTDPTDLGSTGVEIVARPPGKKAQALSMLSGGERALTAVALLFAMLEVRPVPFCVLDEVDAALDEANIGRFADALRSLAHQTQFIVITHNRGTIEAADALYGVTVGDDSVSRVISLRLDEAQALAERDRGDLASVG
jgi:chromosome segregation protein